MAEVERIELRPEDEEHPQIVEALIGREPDHDNFDTLIGGPDQPAVDVYRPDGSLLLAYRCRLVPLGPLRAAYPALVKGTRHTNMRPTAAGRAEEFLSGTLGHLHGEPTVATRADPTVVVLLRELDRHVPVAVSGISVRVRPKPLARV